MSGWGFFGRSKPPPTHTKSHNDSSTLRTISSYLNQLACEHWTSFKIIAFELNLQLFSKSTRQDRFVANSDVKHVCVCLHTFVDSGNVRQKWKLIIHFIFHLEESLCRACGGWSINFAHRKKYRLNTRHMPSTRSTMFARQSTIRFSSAQPQKKVHQIWFTWMRFPFDERRREFVTPKHSLRDLDKLIENSSFTKHRAKNFRRRRRDNDNTQCFRKSFDKLFNFGFCDVRR